MAGDNVRVVSNEENKKVHKGKGLYIIIGILIILLIGLIIVGTCFHIDTIKVTGNIHYTEEEIRNIITEQNEIDNAVLLYLKNKMNPIDDVPFIDYMDIEFVSNHTISVTVYEKAMAGCIEYMNQYIYFDKDGIVLEISEERMQDIPCITGMQFDSMVLHEKLPIDDESRFRLILSMTQLISKYELEIDGIRFTSEDEIILYYKDIKVLLGDGSNIEEKIVDLGSILESLEGKAGTLDMRDFTKEKGNAKFRSE